MKLGVLLAALGLALAGCATTANGPVSRERTEAPPAEPPAAQSRASVQVRDDATQGEGLQIVSNPEQARAYLDNRYVGLTPLLLDDLPQGRYKLTLRKPGYYTSSEWIDYPGGYLVYNAPLELISGFLEVQAEPAWAEVRVGSQLLGSGGLLELPVGSHEVRVRAFGYQEQTRSVEISERAVTTVSFSLLPAEFSLSPLRAARQAFNPRDTGLLGQVRVRFQVSSHGTGTVRVLDGADQEVYSAQLPRFETWEQSLRWDGRDREGRPLPDGLYRLSVSAVADEGQGRAESDLLVRIDASIRLDYRSLWSGSAGLLFCPTPEALGAGSLQLSTLVIGRGASDETLAPLSLAMRLGLGGARRYELDLVAGAITGSPPAAAEGLPLFVAAAFKVPFLGPSTGALRAAAALQAKLAYQNAGADPLADFSGLSVGLPGSLRFGPCTLSASPELVASAWRVSGPGDSSPTGFYSWLYGRLGLLVDLSPFSFGLSAALRSLPFQEGWGLDPPFLMGLEAHWLVPGTQLFLTLALTAELQSTQPQARLAGGGGAGLLR